MGKFKKSMWRKLNQVDRPMCDCCKVNVADWMDGATGFWVCTPCKNKP